MEYVAAPQVRTIANHLIKKFHSHLSPIRIEYVFLSETPLSKGKEAWGRAKLKTGLDAWLATPEDEREPDPRRFFVIEISRSVWDSLSEKRRTALVDHELSHCWIDEHDELKLVSHDVEEFGAVVARHGLWNLPLETFGKMVQARLPFEEAA